MDEAYELARRVDALERRGITVKVEATHTDAIVPRSGHPGDAGLDLHVLGGPFTIHPNESVDLPTGLKIELPTGVWARITGRSSTLRRKNLFVNEGVIDQGYRGELFVFVTNRNNYPVTVVHGDRLAQLIPSPVYVVTTMVVPHVAPSARGEQGFGSTGLSGWENKVDAQTDPVIYLGGPIDYRTPDVDPDDKHRTLAMLLRDTKFKVFCPWCAQAKDRLLAVGVVQRDLLQLMAAEWAVFVWDVKQPSIGVPVEIWTRATSQTGHLMNHGARTLVVGSLGDGIFARYLTEAGVRVVSSLHEAAGIIAYGAGGPDGTNADDGTPG